MEDAAVCIMMCGSMIVVEAKSVVISLGDMVFVALNYSHMMKCIIR